MNNPQVAKHVKALKDGNADIRVAAVGVLGEIGDASAVPVLIQALKDEDSFVRQRAAYTLEKIGDAAAVPALIQALQDENQWVRRNAAAALGKIGDAAVVPALIRALKDENKFVRLGSVFALGKIGHASAVPALIQALKNENSDVRQAAAEALGKIGVSAVPALILALKDKDNWVRQYAAEALGKIGDSVTLPYEIVAATQFTAREKIEVLADLRRVYKDTKGTLKYDIPETRALCQMVLKEDDIEARAGAQAVLNYIMLGRPSQPDEMTSSQELLRATQGGTAKQQPETLLRGADKPQPSHPRTLRERLFGKGKSVAE